jgi:hypothetical protein
MRIGPLKGNPRVSQETNAPLSAASCSYSVSAKMMKSKRTILCVCAGLLSLFLFTPPGVMVFGYASAFPAGTLGLLSLASAIFAFIKNESRKYISLFGLLAASWVPVWIFLVAPALKDDGYTRREEIRLNDGRYLVTAENSESTIYYIKDNFDSESRKVISAEEFYRLKELQN